jgi:hypothetical protein
MLIGDGAGACARSLEGPNLGPIDAFDPTTVHAGPFGPDDTLRLPLAADVQS